MDAGRVLPARFPFRLVVVGAIALVAVLAVVNITATATPEVDRRVGDALFAARGTSIRTITQRFTVVGSAPVVAALGVALGAIVWWRRRDELLAAWCAAVAPIALVTEILLKNIVRRAPPAEKVPYVEPINSFFADLFQPGRYSFPSGHASLSAALATLVALLAWQALGSGWRRTAVAGASLALSLLVAASRVVLGVHFFTDVVAGLAVGVAVALAGTRGLELVRGYRSSSEMPKRPSR